MPAFRLGRGLVLRAAVVAVVVLAAWWTAGAMGTSVVLIAGAALLLCAQLDPEDITRLEGEEQRCRALAEAARVFILQFTTDGTIVYMNRYAEEVSGYSREEAIGRNFLDLFVPERDRERVRADTQPVLAGEPVSNYRGMLRTKSGEEKMMLWGAAATVGLDGRPCGVVAFGTDVTELYETRKALQRSEELYRTLVEHSLAGVFIHQNNRFVFANRRAEQIVGYSLEEVRDTPIWELVHPDDRAFAMQCAADRLRGEEPVQPYEYRVITRSGETRVVEVWAARIEYQDRDAVLATVIDITDRRKSEEDKLRAERELERHKRDFCRQTVTAVTEGKLEVLEPDEICAAIEGARVTVAVESPEDVGLARHLIERFALNAGITGRRLEELVLAVGEAAANALKHAGGGRVAAGLREGQTVWVGVVDHGPGMDTLMLTQAVLGKGFSTKPSLGFGYTFILEYSDHVLLSTSRSGTTVVIEKQIAEPPPVPRLDLSKIPDLW